MTRSEAAVIIDPSTQNEAIRILSQKYKDGDEVEANVREACKMAADSLRKEFVPVIGSTFDGKQVYYSTQEE